jgi:8-oxo-dGTP pyrophosphatase MutT (NUDIX family)
MPDPDRLIAFDRSADEASPPHDAPLPLALFALWCGDRVLLVFDRHRQVWELPGGMIEPPESPREAAVRELREETGQAAHEPVTFVGYARFALGPEQRPEYGALFAGRARRCVTPREFRPNEEISAVRWWDPRHAVPSRAEAIDVRLARLSGPVR